MSYKAAPHIDGRRSLRSLAEWLVVRSEIALSCVSPAELNFGVYIRIQIVAFLISLLKCDRKLNRCLVSFFSRLITKSISPEQGFCAPSKGNSPHPLKPTEISISPGCNSHFQQCVECISNKILMRALSFMWLFCLTESLVAKCYALCFCA